MPATLTAAPKAAAPKIAAPKPVAPSHDAHKPAAPKQTPAQAIPHASKPEAAKSPSPILLLARAQAAPVSGTAQIPAHTGHLPQVHTGPVAPAAPVHTAQHAPGHAPTPALPAFVRAAIAAPLPAAKHAGDHALKTAAIHPSEHHSEHPLPHPAKLATAHPEHPHAAHAHPPVQAMAPELKPALPKPAEHKAHHPVPAKPIPRPQPKLAHLASKGPSSGSGHPLLPHVKEAIQKSLLVDLSSVRIHASSHAQNKTASLNARAFTFGNDIFLGRGEHPTDLTLISHEAAHVIQQQGGSAIQTWSSDRSDRFEREADMAASAVRRGETFAVRERVESPRVQRLGISDALDYFADAANNIPGFRMFTIVLGVNPINMSHVERSPANVLRAVVEFIPGGAQITQALDKYGVFDKVGNWVQEQLDTLAMTGSAIKKAVMDFLDSLSWTDIFHLGDVWERAKRIFTEPIDRIKSFVKGLLEGIWKFVREAILKPIAALASKTSGWDLLTAVLGSNPITGEAVPRTAETLIGGFMKLIHEDEIWENIKKANAIPRAWAWFQGALAGLMGFVKQIPDLFKGVLKSLEWTDILDLPSGFRKIAVPFGTFLGNFLSWAGNTIWTLLELIFEVVAPAVMPYLKKVGAAFRGILKNPMAFMKNLIAAGKLGFENFGAHFLTHLKTGLIDWLTGSLPGVYIPKAINLLEIAKFAMSVLGISWAQIRAKIVKALGPNGEKIVSTVEKTLDILVTLFNGGPGAIWDLIKEKLTNLQDMVIGGITSFVIDTIVKKAVPKLIAMFIPGAGFISAIVSIYDTVMVFVQKLAKIVAAVKAFVDSIVAIANGQIEGAANKVENTLAGLLSLAISFLAGFLGLGNIASKVLAVIEKIRATVDKALDVAINWIITKAKALFDKLFGKKDKPDEAVDPEKQKKIDAGIATLHDKEKASQSVQKDQKITQEDAQAAAAQTKAAHPVFKSFTVVDGGDNWNYVYEASPPKTIPGLSKEESIEVRKAKAEFKKGYFSREELEPVLGLAKSATVTRLSKWQEVGQVFKYASAPSDAGTQYTFDQEAAGFRPTNPNNREKFGYHNPAKTSGTGLAILSKKFNPGTPKPIEAGSSAYHTTKARYDSARPGSSYTGSNSFMFPVAVLGHKDGMGASDHWNKIGHKQTKDANKAWNNDPNNYQGPEHEAESAASGGSSARYEAPSKARGSDPSWYT